MRMDDEHIRSAIDRRLSGLNASAGRRERIRQRIMKAEEPVVKKKISVGMVLVIAALLALMGVALAASLNLFAFFGKQDARLAKIAPQTSLATETPQTVESNNLGTTVASISSAYYDGQSLLVAYSIENGTRLERFTPAPEQLGQMTKLDDFPLFEAMSEEDRLILKEFTAARESAMPYGITRYSVYPSDHTETDDGIDLPPETERQESMPEGGQYMLREYENPLPEEVQNRESLSIQIPLYQSASSFYFDGKDCYMLSSESQEAGAMTATVLRADAQTRHFVGEGTYNGAQVHAEADASAVRAQITVSSDVDLFTALPEDSWYMLDVRDAKGNTLRVTECGTDGLRTLRADLEGTGILPDQLTVSILIESEGEDATTASSAPILLTMNK